MDRRAVDLLGRDDELAVIEQFLDQAEQPARALLIEGEAGIGKTSLCAATVASARVRGYETLATRSVAAEATLALAGVGDLLEPVLEHVLAELPPPQALVLRVALLLEEQDAAPDPRALGIAFRASLRILAAETPVLVVVDDLQWLDSSSQEVVRFAARRLDKEPVAFVFARRAGHGDNVVATLDRLEQLRVGGLSAGALHRLLHERLELVLSRPALRRLHELSVGNPFYALELGRAYQEGSIRLQHGDPLPPTLDALVGARIAALPERTREILAVAAARPRPLLPLPEALEALAPAVDADVAVLEGDEIHFTHPLLAAAAYSALSADRRRILHRRIASDASDVEERARHLALSTAGPDAAVALELELAARRARSRGAVATAAELAERAVALTPPGDDEATHRRILLAARLRFESGDASGPRRTLEQVVTAWPSGSTRAEAMSDLARIYMFEGSRRRAVSLLRTAFEEAEEGRLRAVINQRLTGTLTLLREDLRGALEQARAFAAWAERAGDRHVLVRALAALGFVGGVMGAPDAVGMLERGEELEREADGIHTLERPTHNLAGALMWTDELEPARSMFTSLFREAAEQEDEVSLAWTAANLANLEFLAGSWDEALRWATEAEATAAQTGQPAQQAYALATKALVHAHRGDGLAARATAAQALDLSGDEVAIGWMNARWALGVLELSLGDAAAAHDVLDPASTRVEKEQIAEPGTTRFVFDDVEALILLGRTSEAERRLAHVEAHAERLDRAFALAAAGRCRALLALAAGDRSSALGSLDTALAQHARTPVVFDRARTLLARGTALRLARRRREARVTLEEAAAIFERLGAAVFARRARDELARIGGRIAAGSELTPAERKVTDLVAQGLRNHEVAAALFVTTKTVEFHLRNAYRKLGIHSRAELARRKA